MRTRILAMVLTLAVATVSASNFAMEVEISKLEKTLINLKLTNLKGESDLFIKDVDGQIIYKEHLTEDYQFRKFDVDHLIDGKYSIELHGDISIQKFSFEIDNEELIIESSEAEEFFKPVAYMKGNRVSVNFLAKDLDQDLELSFFDADHHKLYTETISGKDNMGKVLDITNLEKGDYTLIMSNNGRVFSKVITKR